MLETKHTQREHNGQTLQTNHTQSEQNGQTLATAGVKQHEAESPVKQGTVQQINTK